MLFDPNNTTNPNCEKCGKPKCLSTTLTQSSFQDTCKCDFTGELPGISPESFRVAFQGWQCPACLTVYGPFISSCRCQTGAVIPQIWGSNVPPGGSTGNGSANHVTIKS